VFVFVRLNIAEQCSPMFACSPKMFAYSPASVSDPHGATFGIWQEFDHDTRRCHEDPAPTRKEGERTIDDINDSIPF
jgi:hypothetical protein